MSEGHSHDHKSTNVRSLSWALGLTSTFLVAEVIGGIITGSLALISDAAHMMTDAIGLAIALAATKISQRPADSRRTFGYQRFEILAAAFNALLLFGVAGYILVEGYKRFTQPQEVQSVTMMIIATLGLIINMISMRLLSSGKTTSLNVKGAYLEVWSDFMGSVGVILAAAVIWFTGWTWVDPLIAIGIGLWVLPRTWTLLKETVNVLLEGVPDGIDLDAVNKALSGISGVSNVHDLHVWALSSDAVSLSAHLIVSNGSNDAAIRAAAIEVLDRQFHITHITLQTEAVDCRNDKNDNLVH